MTQQFTNNGTGTLASGITNVATSATLNGGDGANFPVLVGNDFFYATLYQIVSGIELNWEIVKVTARVTDTLTIVRGQQGTTARAFSTGDPVQLRWTKADADTAMVQIPVRQTVLAGALNSAGAANLLAAGSGLALNLAATAVAVQLAFAAGFSASGEVDYISQLVADVTGVVSSIPANNTSYIGATYVDRGSVTWNQTLNPPQYGYTYDRTKQSLMRFAGADTSTTFIDDYGNTWAAFGNAQVDTAVQIDTLNTLLLDGTGDYAESTSITSLGGGSWTLECKIRWNTLPTAGTSQYIVTARSAVSSAFGITNTAGVIKAFVNLSSNNSTLDIASGLLGTKTTWATGTTYHFALTYDALAGKYFLYVDGLQDATVTSALRVNGFTKLNIGSDATPAQYVNGAIAGFRMTPYCRYPNGTTFTAPTVSTFAVEGDYFSIPQMTMYSVTSASGSAGVDPGMTAANKVYVGECDTGAATVTAVRNYAYQGKYLSAEVATSAASVKTVFAANIGVPAGLVLATMYLRNFISELGFFPGDTVAPFTYQVTSGISFIPLNYEGRNTVNVSSGNQTPQYSVVPKAGGAASSVTAINWRMFVAAQRSF